MGGMTWVEAVSKIREIDEDTICEQNGKPAGKFRSRKREDFEIGLSSVQSVARKGQGDARFESDGLVFLSSVYVRI